MGNPRGKSDIVWSVMYWALVLHSSWGHQPIPLLSFYSGQISHPCLIGWATSWGRNAVEIKQTGTEQAVDYFVICLVTISASPLASALSPPSACFSLSFTHSVRPNGDLKKLSLFGQGFSLSYQAQWVRLTVLPVLCSFFPKKGKVPTFSAKDWPFYLSLTS